MTQIKDWFRCPRCNERDSDLHVRQILAVGNFSLELECDNCRFIHEDRDATSDNWNTNISIKQLLTGKTIRAPSASKTVHESVVCPSCFSEDVDVWIFSENSGVRAGKPIGHVRLDCRNCSEHMTTEVTHK